MKDPTKKIVISSLIGMVVSIILERIGFIDWVIKITVTRNA